MADLEDRLRDMLHEQAAGVVPPSTPADLAGQVRRRRRRHRATRIAAAAATAGVVVGGVVLVGIPQITDRHRGQPATVSIDADDVARVCGPGAPSSTSMALTVDVWFDGTRAFYSGPTQLKAGTRITFHLTSSVKDAAVAEGDIPDSVTCERAYRDVAARKFDDHPDYLTNIDWYVGDLTVTLTPGRHEVVVGLPPPPKGTDAVALAAVIEAS